MFDPSSMLPVTNQEFLLIISGAVLAGTVFLYWHKGRLAES